MMFTRNEISFDEWLVQLSVVAEEYGYMGNIVEDTGDECWRHWYDNYETAASAFFDDMSNAD